ncbi:MAG: UDP-N-acetylmuramoyl-tripeptide--D-alanyl-D-alanine ligase [Burkholderiaceae bacterium]|nr:MAG: UDP-N-acetylmuramoyl-tripeptide--D-alanyl-D-alanine ligase [Burkholderiaceae bacterium]
MMSLQQAQRWIPGSRLQGDGNTVLASVSTDSRSLKDGELFIALKGERFDAHNFLTDTTLQQRAAAVVAEHLPSGFNKPALLVDNTLHALGALAAGWRSQFTLPVIAVTGSNGKTTVKEMIAAILAAHCGEAQRLATQGNFNNEIGVPLTLFRMNAQHRAAVIELGMNHIGEIDTLAKITQATVALVNNAQREHQEFMQSVAAVARENGNVISALGPDGIAVFPADEEHTPIWRELAGARRVIDFAQHSTAAVTGYGHAVPGGTQLKMFTPQGDLECLLPAQGEHNVRNALAATACALAADVPLAAIRAGLSAFQPAPGRLQFKRSTQGVTVIDDTYNANPDSVRAAIDVLAAAPTLRVLVLGDMGEVGDQGPQFHREIGAYARSKGIDVLLATGPLMRDAVATCGGQAQHFEQIEDLIACVQPLVQPGMTVLIKGSRFMRMERVVQTLLGETNPTKETH